MDDEKYRLPRIGSELMKRDTNWVSESTVAIVRSNVLAEVGRVAVCWSEDGMSLNLRTEMVTVLGADVRSCEFVAL